MDPSVTAIADIYSANMDQFQRQLDELRNTATIDAPSLASLNKEFAAFRQRMHAMLDTIKANYIKLECRIEELEAKGRRKWLLFHGVKEEVVDNPRELVLATVNDKLGYQLTNTSIAACHRLGKAKNQQNPRPILIKFRDREDRYSIWTRKKQLKGTRLLITESLIPTRQQLYNEARQLFTANRCWTSDGKVIVKYPDDSKSTITTSSQLQSAKDKLASMQADSSDRRPALRTRQRK